MVIREQVISRIVFSRSAAQRMSVLMFTLLFLCGVVVGQESDELRSRLYLDALLYASGANKPYKPEKGLMLMTSLANEGHPKAMNALGIMYARGDGTKTDYKMAMGLFRKAAEAGYFRAYYNMSLMWKYGYGVDQNETESYNVSKKGADMGDPDCLYGVGYMHYKGIGCRQDYRLAMDYFQKAAESSSHAGATYMIGLCLRNGYGVERDTAEAREWLMESRRFGNLRAAIELSTEKPENSFHNARMLSGKRYKVDIPEKLRKVEHNAIGSILSGRFDGYVITYDWSGQYIVNISPLTLTLAADDDGITGRWVENDTITAEIRGVLTDTALSFIDVSYERPNHYSPEPFRSEFTTANINISADSTSVYLTGNLQLFSDITMEPMQPVYISLKSAAEDGTDTKITGQDSAGAKLLAFPNPFTGELWLSIDLAEEAEVHVEVFATSGALVLEADCGRLLPGRNIIPLTVTVAPGVYLVRIRYGNKEASFTVVKS